MSDNGNDDGNKLKGNKKNQKSCYKKSYGIQSHWIGKEKELGNNVYVYGHKMQLELHITTAEEIIEWVGKKRSHEMTLLVKKGIGFALTEPEEPMLGEKEKVIPQMKMKKYEMAKRCCDDKNGQVWCWQGCSVPIVDWAMSWCHEEQDWKWWKFWWDQKCSVMFGVHCNWLKV